MFNIPTHLLAKVTVTETTSAVTLSVNPIVTAALSFTPRHLLLRAEMQATSGNPNVFTRLNGDSGSNYNVQTLTAYGTTRNGAQDTSEDKFALAGNIDDLSNAFSVSETLFPDALSTRTHKSALCQTGRLEEVVRLAGGRWENTAAITSIQIYVDSSTFAAGSTFELAVVDEAYVIDETINTGAAQFDHASISAADGDLVIIGNLRSDVSSNIEEVSIRFNNDTGGNYARQRMNIGNGTNIGAYADTSPVIAHGAAANADANSFSGLLVQIPNFSDGSNDRNAHTFGGSHFSDSDQIIGLYTNRWNNTTAINRVAIYGKNASSGFLANSMLSIYAVPKNLITRTELGSDATVTFSSIPQTYDHLEISWYARSDRASSDQDNLNMGFNGDTTAANYDMQRLIGTASTLTALQSAAILQIGNISAADSGANIFGSGTVTIYNYTKTDRHKHRFSIGGQADLPFTIFTSSRWENTAAITSVELTPNAGTNFLAGSVFTLRGINPPAAAATDIETINGIAASNIEAVN